MTVNELIKEYSFETLVLSDGQKMAKGAYAGDLLSWVMGRAAEGNVFVTIMTNVNVVAVAALVEVACVIFAENVAVGDDVIAAAEQKGVNLLRSKNPAYEVCVSLGKCL